jgi:hypothetical protein
MTDESGGTKQTKTTKGKIMTLYVYVDNSNIWIEGQRIQAVRQGLAPDIRAALRQNITAPWTYDFGRLYDLLCPPGAPVGRSILFGSRPPEFVKSN